MGNMKKDLLHVFESHSRSIITMLEEKYGVVTNEVSCSIYLFHRHSCLLTYYQKHRKHGSIPSHRYTNPHNAVNQTSLPSETKHTITPHQSTA